MGKSWAMKQQWCDLLFAHWPLAPAVLAPLIPEPLRLEAFDGHAWIGIVPFRMQGIRMRYLPPIPGTSAFPECNVRTYVQPKAGGKPGVFFFSLEAANTLAVKAARRWFHLPYFKARMSIEPSGDGFAYETVRTHAGARPAEFRGFYAPTGEIYRARAGDLDHWLTERYCLYAVDGKNRLFRGDVAHEAWPLQPARAEIETNTLAPVPLPASDPLLHFAGHLDVRIHSLEKVS
ncbi:MAG: DUF2071 domain-containing protein [Planctomycetota bacterium]|nr:DUF2071 domain-containing protein [Planctomycetota bacterium]